MPRLLDLFCGAGGAAVGYHRAGFDEIVGVDIKPQPRYPFTFVQADALEYVREHGREFDAIHASPPCQAYSALQNFVRRSHADLYNATRERLRDCGSPWAIENVVGAPYQHGIELCGSMFSLGVRRHRNFETRDLILNPLRCDHNRQGRVISVCGHPGGKRALRGRAGSTSEWREVMGIDWMTALELAQAIPPAYTEFIGRQLLEAIR